MKGYRYTALDGETRRVEIVKPLSGGWYEVDFNGARYRAHRIKLLRDWPSCDQMIELGKMPDAEEIRELEWDDEDTLADVVLFAQDLLA